MPDGDRHHPKNGWPDPSWRYRPECVGSNSPDSDHESRTSFSIASKPERHPVFTIVIKGDVMPEVTRRTALVALGGAALTGALTAGSTLPAHAAPRPNRTVTVYLVRHGQTWMNYTGRVQG